MHELGDAVENFTSTDIYKNSSLKEIQASDRTIRRSLRRLGYSYDQCHKKRQLAEDHLKHCLIFAQRCQKLPTKFWTERMSFHLDGHFI